MKNEPKYAGINILICLVSVFYVLPTNLAEKQNRLTNALKQESIKNLAYFFDVGFI
jgi:hypothetical protein